MLIGQILKDKGGRVVTVSPEDSIAELAATLKREKIGAAVVTDAQGKLVGIISERDLARGLADHGAALVEKRVADLMTHDVFTCSLQYSLEKLMKDMTERRIRHLPVVEDGELVGIISIGDVVKHRLHELEEEAHSLQEYIHGGR